MSRMSYVRPAALVAAGLAMTGSVATAGGMAPAIMVPDVIVQETKSSSSSTGIIVPLILIALVALAMSKTTSTPVPVIED